MEKSSQRQANTNPMAPLAKSASKEQFLNRLGMSPNDPGHARLYKLMKAEAVAGIQRLSYNHESLSAVSRSQGVKPPYSWRDMTETATWREVLNIWNIASPETKPIYDQGGYQNGQNQENWVIEWLLWHVYRYREQRGTQSALLGNSRNFDGGNGGGQGSASPFWNTVL